MQWPALMDTYIAPAAGIRGKVRTRVWKAKTPLIVYIVTLTPEQRAQLATPSYKLKKEKREAKKL